MLPTAGTMKTRFQKYFTADALRAYLAEFLSTFLYVLSIIGCTMSIKKVSPSSDPLATNLVALAMANAFSLSTAVYVAGGVSGGHVNPAVTFGMAVGGHVAIPTLVFYWIAQIVGSSMACLLLKVTLVRQVPPYSIAQEMTGFGASLLEGVLTFALVYAVYAATDPRRGACGGIGTLFIGIMAGAGVLASAPFSGGALNPALSFGAAAVGGSFRNQAVYWVGPLIGAAVASLLYENVIFPTKHVSDSPRGGGRLEGSIDL